MKKSPFIVPDGYFEDFASKMHPWETEASTGAAAGRTVRVHSVGRAVRYACSVAAGLAVLVTGTLFAFGVFGSRQADGLEEGYLDFLYSDVMPMADPEAIFNPDFDVADSAEEISQEDVMEYLINSGISAEETYMLLAESY